MRSLPSTATTYTRGATPQPSARPQYSTREATGVRAVLRAIHTEQGKAVGPRGSLTWAAPARQANSDRMPVPQPTSCKRTRVSSC
jgi:hypothetical protein